MTAAEKKDHGWEYQVVVQRSWMGPEKLGNHLNKVGGDGWELVSVVYNPEMGYTLFYFKRRSEGKERKKTPAGSLMG